MQDIIIMAAKKHPLASSYEDYALFSKLGSRKYDNMQSVLSAGLTSGVSRRYFHLICYLT